MTKAISPAVRYLAILTIPAILAVSIASTAGTAGAQAARVFNQGCGPVATWPRLRLTQGTPKIGTQIQLTGSLLAPARTTLTAIGLSNTNWGTVKLPLMLDPLPGPPCQLLVSPDVILFGKSTTNGQQVWTFQIPNDRQLIGLKLYLQMAAKNASGLEHWTDGLELTFG